MLNLTHMIRCVHAWFLPRSVPEDIRELSRSNLLVGTILTYLAIGGITTAAFFIATMAPNVEAVLLRYGALVAVYVVFGGVLLLYRATGRRVLCANLLAGSTALLLTVIAVLTGGIEGPLPLVFVMVPATATFLANRTSGIGWGVGMVAVMASLDWLHRDGVEFMTVAPPQNLARAESLILFLVLVLVVAALQIYDYMADRLAAELQGERNRFAFLAEHDPLTKLPNRATFAARLSESIARTCRTKVSFALIYIDLDQFKLINDSRGHAVGDIVLQRLALRMAASTRENDTAARLGGDEFALLLDGIHSDEVAISVARKLLSTLSEPIWVGREQIRVTASIGIVLHPDCPGDAGTLERYADLAMYNAKAQRNTFHLHKLGAELAD